MKGGKKVEEREEGRKVGREDLQSFRASIYR
jgi:hypothetical protein